MSKQMSRTPDPPTSPEKKMTIVEVITYLIDCVVTEIHNGMTKKEAVKRSVAAINRIPKARDLLLVYAIEDLLPRLGNVQSGRVLQ